MLFTSISSPGSSLGGGKPKVFGHVFGAYILPFTDQGWNNFWKSEDDEKQRRTLIFFPLF